MKLINPSVELIPQTYDLNGIYKQIEICGRVSYKSENKISNNSAEKFVNMLIQKGHTAPLEHGTVYLHLTNFSRKNINCYINNPYSKVISITQYELPEPHIDYYVTTNYKVLYENNWLKDLEFLCEPTKHHIKRTTVKFVCDRGVSHEFVRHRMFSYMQESTRYCNYSKDKFDNQLTFVIPSWLPDGDHLQRVENILYRNFENTEKDYLDMLKEGLTPQQARQVLPTGVKTELIMTGTDDDWNGFFELRCSPNAHPDARYLAEKARNLILSNNNS